MASQRARSSGKLKLLLLGAADVGKTAFVVRLVTRRFIGEYDQNKGSLHDYTNLALVYFILPQHLIKTLYTHRLTYTDRDDVQLDILDSANNPDDAQLETNIKWADAFILLYSVTDHQSFLRLDAYLALIGHLRRHDDMLGNGPALVLVANKADCPAHARHVTSEEGRGLSARLDRPIYELSVAESPECVVRVVDDVIRQVRHRDVTGSRPRVGNTSPNCPGASQDRMSAFTNVKRVLREKIYKGSRSDSWMTPGFDRLGK